MRVLLTSHAYTAEANLAKVEALARLPDMGLSVIAPRVWHDYLRTVRMESRDARAVQLLTLPVLFSGRSNAFVYSPLSLWKALESFRPDLLHIEQEPYSLAALEFLLLARMAHVRAVSLFSWDNIDRAWGYPKTAIERFVLSRLSLIVAGSSGAERRLRRQGFRGPVRIMPLVGVDPELFRPRDRVPPRPFTVGFVGRLVPEKGIGDLLRAFALLPRESRLVIVGRGELEPFILRRSQELGFLDRMTIEPPVPHRQVARLLGEMDVLVLPSRSAPHWVEQFGHVLIEAMSSGVPVVGSSSGAIPEVIGEAGLIFPEADPQALGEALERLWKDLDLRRELAKRGRARVLQRYTHERVSGTLRAAFVEVLDGAGGGPA